MAELEKVVSNGEPNPIVMDASAIAELAKNPKFQSILQKHMNADNPRAYYESLPLPVKHRVRALKNLQVKVVELEAKFYEEVQQLEAKYQAMYQPLLDKRSDIVNGRYEPTEEEYTWADSDDDEDEDAEEDKVAIGNGKADQSTDDSAKSSSNEVDQPVAGIPDYWLTALKNTDVFGDIIMEHDEPILKHLTDIKLLYGDKTGMSFSLEFHFSENEYFTNKTLSTTYQMSVEVASDDPFSFEGASISTIKGCKIDWKKGKNVTVKTIKKKQKHKGKGQSRVITKTVPNDSFFSFFSPTDRETIESKEDDEEAEELLNQYERDIVRAEFLRDRLINRSVLYFTGEIEDDNDDMDEMGMDEADEEEGDESDDDYNPHSDVQNAKPPECKNQ